MKRKIVKKLAILMLAMTLAFSATACGGQQPQKVEESASEKKASYPMTIVDQAGREVVIEKKPQSLVSSYYITTSAILALDLKEALQGVESNPERRVLYKMCAPDVLERTQVGSPKEFDLEVCATLQPDLVILPMRAKDMVDPLEKLGITVMVVNPESQSDVIEMLQLIGQATGCEERAMQLTAFIQEKTDFLKERMEGCERPKVYLGGNSSFLSTASKGMYQNDLITLAGGLNVAGEIDDTYWVESSYEQILAWEPQFIIMASEAKYSEDEILAETNLQACQAIAEQKVYRIPADVEAWDSPVPSGILGAVYLASVLHPDLVSTKEYEAMVEEYYEKFYGFSYTENKNR